MPSQPDGRYDASADTDPEKCGAGAGRSCMLIHEDCAAGEFPVQGWRYFGRTCRGQVSYLNRGHPGGMNPERRNGNGIPIFSLRINKVDSNNGNNS